MTNVTQCDICGMIEVLPWFEQPMNETIRDYARKYVSPVKIYYKDLEEAMRVWEEKYETTNY